MGETIVGQGLLQLLNVRNLLDNGGFEIWQRGITSVPDRWKLPYGASMAWNVRQSASEITGGGDCCCEVCDITTITGGDWMFMYQCLENYKEYRGKTISVSVWVKSDTDKVYLALCDGEFSYPWEYPRVFHSGSGDWERLTITRTVINNAANIYPAIGVGPNASGLTSEYFKVDNMMMVVSDKPVEYVPVPPLEEWNRCLAYYEKFNWQEKGKGVYSNGSHGYAVQTMVAHYHFVVRKHATPTLTISNIGGSVYDNLGVYVDLIPVGPGWSSGADQYKCQTWAWTNQTNAHNFGCQVWGTGEAEVT